MHFKTAASVAVLACAAHVSAHEANGHYKAHFMGIPGLSLARRDTNGYVPEQSTCHDGNTCADACGAGYTQCPSSGDHTHCFNPAASESCCSDGSGNSCDAGYYCTHDKTSKTWCCPANMTLDECAKVYGVSGALESVAALDTAQPASSTSAGHSTTSAATSSAATTTHAGSGTQTATNTSKATTTGATSSAQDTSAASSAQDSETTTGSGASATDAASASASATSDATNSDSTSAADAGAKATADASGGASSAGSRGPSGVAAPTGAVKSAGASGTGSSPPLQTTSGAASVAATSGLGLLLALGAGMAALL